MFTQPVSMKLLPECKDKEIEKKHKKSGHKQGKKVTNRIKILKPDLK